MQAHRVQFFEAGTGGRRCSAALAETLFQGDQTRSGHQVEGAGLGLALVAQLVEAWDGRLSITQVLATDWTRTDVSFTLPRKPQSGMPAAGEDVQTDPA